MRRILNYTLVLLYLFAGIAPALHLHEHDHASPLDYSTSDVAAHNHSGCSHHHHHDEQPGDETESGHSHKHAPFSPHEHSDDCVICQIAVQAGLVEVATPTLLVMEIVTPVFLRSESVFAEPEHTSLCVRGPPAEIC